MFYLHRSKRSGVLLLPPFSLLRVFIWIVKLQYCFNHIFVLGSYHRKGDLHNSHFCSGFISQISIFWVLGSERVNVEEEEERNGRMDEVQEEESGGGAMEEEEEE